MDSGRSSPYQASNDSSYINNPPSGGTQVDSVPPQEVEDHSSYHQHNEDVFTGNGHTSVREEQLGSYLPTYGRDASNGDGHRPVVGYPKVAAKQLPPSDMMDEDDDDEEDQDDDEDQEEVLKPNAEDQDDTERHEDEITPNEDDKNVEPSEDDDVDDTSRHDDPIGAEGNESEDEMEEDDVEETSRTEDPISKFVELDETSRTEDVIRKEEDETSRMDEDAQEDMDNGSSTPDPKIGSDGEHDEDMAPERDSAPSTLGSPRPFRGKVLKKKRPPPLKRLISDSISVNIPMSLTVDLGVAIKRCRAKRVAALYERFPELESTDKKGDDTEDQEAVDEDGEGGAEKVEKLDKRPKLAHVPKRSEYSSIMDYLEAKYVQGVMVGEEEEQDDDEGQGSVYSETSFLDDSGLQRTVAEQVMGQATTTKLELQEDDAFFVNVGELEVEESEMTKKGYDPLQDLKNDAKKSRKRKKAPAESEGGAKATQKPAAKKKQAAAKQTEPPKKKAKATGTSEKKKKPAPTPKTTAKTESAKADPKEKPIPDDPETIKLFNAAADQKIVADELLEELIEAVKGFTSDQLPQKEKPAKFRVLLTVPEGKKTGDMIRFSNPHDKTIKCHIKIPEGKGPGDSFRAVLNQPTPQTVESESTDHNNIPREFYGVLDDFARAFDEWCDTEGVYRKAVKDKDFSAHLKKRSKFDKVIEVFPIGLKTPVDKAYLQRILRRARQSKQKRAQTLARQQHHVPTETKMSHVEERTESPNAKEPETETKQQESAESDDEDENESADEQEDEAPADTKKVSWRYAVPKPSLAFPTKKFDTRAFDQAHH